MPYLQQAFENEAILEELLDAYKGIFTCDRELVAKHEKIHFCFAGSNLPWTPEKDYKIHDKTELCSFIGSGKNTTKGHNFRHRLLRQLSVRVAGQPVAQPFGTMTGKAFGFKPGCHLEQFDKIIDIPWHDKSEALNNFMFSIVIENAQYDDYFTEKITDCFATGTIPVYWGTKNIGKHFNSDGIIELPSDGFGDGDVELADFILTNRLTSDLYYSKMDAIKDNLERVKNMHSADDMMFNKIQELNS